jgi:hypothetical protein
MTEPLSNDPTEPAGEPTIEEHGSDPQAGGGAGSARSKEWLAQLESMIQDVATQAAPVARQIGAKAAELAAVAAVKAGPFAQKVAVVTTEQGQRFADKASAVAAELRAQDAPAETDAAAPEAAAWPATDAPHDETPVPDQAPAPNS